MVSLNRVLLAGNLVRDPEMKETINGKYMTTFPVAVDKRWRTNSGELKKETAYFRIIVWNSTAENCARYLKKGRSVLIEGRLETRTYKNSEGKTQYLTQIVGDQVTFLNSSDGKPAIQDEHSIASKHSSPVEPQNTGGYSDPVERQTNGHFSEPVKQPNRRSQSKKVDHANKSNEEPSII